MTRVVRWMRWAGWVVLLGAACPVRPAGFQETFDADPAVSGWERHGDASLFRWDGVGKALEVTWDSSRTNSYFLRRLGTVVTERDDFGFGFEVALTRHQVGADPLKPGTFQIALGLLNVADATADGFRRAVLFRSRNLVEWGWFGAQPDGAIAASVSPVAVPADGKLPWGYSDTFFEMEAGATYGFEFRYVASTRTMSGTVRVAGQAAQELAPVRLPSAFTGFRVDALSVNSYSDAGQDPRYAGSVLATGRVDNLWWAGPDAAVGAVRFTGNGGQGRVTLATRRGWLYRLEASSDLEFWNQIGGEVAGTGSDVELIDARRAAFPHQFYRVEARLP